MLWQEMAHTFRKRPSHLSSRGVLPDLSKLTGVRLWLGVMWLPGEDSDIGMLSWTNLSLPLLICQSMQQLQFTRSTCKTHVPLDEGSSHSMFKAPPAQKDVVCVRFYFWLCVNWRTRLVGLLKKVSVGKTRLAYKVNRLLREVSVSLTHLWNIDETAVVPNPQPDRWWQGSADHDR